MRFSPEHNPQLEYILLTKIKQTLIQNICFSKITVSFP